jgi:hypothetical protein
VIFDLEIPGSGCNLGWNATPIKSNIFVFPN